MNIDLVANVFFGMIACEGRAEQERQKLDSIEKYAPQQTFDYLKQFQINGQAQLDKQALKNDGISIQSLEDFLTFSKIKSNPQYLSLIINMFSLSNQKTLDFQNFQKITGPSYKQNYSSKIFSSDKKDIPHNLILKSISKIFEIELNLWQHIEQQKSKYPSQTQNIEKCFKSFDFKNQGYLDYEEVNTFMKNSGRPFSQRDYQALLRRIKKTFEVTEDIIWFEEFAQILTQQLSKSKILEDLDYSYVKQKVQPIYSQPPVAYQDQQPTMRQSNLFKIENQYQQNILNSNQVPNFVICDTPFFIEENFNKKFPVIPSNPYQNRELNEAMDSMFHDKYVDRIQLVGNPMQHQTYPNRTHASQNMSMSMSMRNQNQFNESISKIGFAGSQITVGSQLIGPQIAQQLIGRSQLQYPISPPSQIQKRKIQ